MYSNRYQISAYPISAYSFGFNGKEKYDEVLGGGNCYDYGFRIYNPRLGRFLSVDPLISQFPWYTPYQFAGNKPIACIDIDGLEEFYVTNWYDKEGKLYKSTIAVNEAGGVLKDRNITLSDNTKGIGRKAIVRGIREGSSDVFYFKDELTKNEEAAIAPFILGVNENGEKLIKKHINHSGPGDDSEPNAIGAGIWTADVVIPLSGKVVNSSSTLKPGDILDLNIRGQKLYRSDVIPEDTEKRLDNLAKEINSSTGIKSITLDLTLYVEQGLSYTKSNESTLSPTNEDMKPPYYTMYESLVYNLQVYVNYIKSKITDKSIKINANEPKITTDKSEKGGIKTTVK